jgi:hypothetical protein
VLQEGAAALKDIAGIAEEPPPEVSLVPHLEFGPTIEARYWIATDKQKVRPVQRQVNAALAGVAVGQEAQLPA